MPPISLRVEIAEIQAFLQSQLDARQCTGYFPGNKRLSAGWRFVVEQNAVACIYTVGFTIIDRNPIGVKLCNGIGRTRIERCSFFLWDFLDHAVKF